MKRKKYKIKQSPKCPECGHNENVIPIAYGILGPVDELFEENIHVGRNTCHPGSFIPDWYCKKHELEF